MFCSADSYCLFNELDSVYVIEFLQANNSESLKWIRVLHMWIVKHSSCDKLTNK